MLDSAPLVEPPAGFRAAVWARIDAAEAERARQKRPRFAFDWRSLFRPATLGWAAAVLAVILLAPVVIPGAHTTARLWFPWSLFYRAPVASHVMLGQPQVVDDHGNKWIDVQVTNTGESAARLEVSVDSTSSAQIVIDAPAGSSRWYHVAPAPIGTAQLRATWQEGGRAVSHDFTVSP